MLHGAVIMCHIKVPFASTKVKKASDLILQLVFTLLTNLINNSEKTLPKTLKSCSKLSKNCKKLGKSWF